MVRSSRSRWSEIRIFWFVGSLVVLWIAVAHQRVPMLILGGIAVGLPLGGFLVCSAYISAKEAGDRARAASVKVTEVLDEPLFSERGNLIGIRLSYRAEASIAGTYFLTPYLHNASRSQTLVAFLPLEALVAGKNPSRELRSGEHITLTYRMVPFEYRPNLGCLRALPSDVPPPAPLAINISDSPYTQPHTQGSRPTLHTRHSYDVRSVWDGLRSDGVPVCSTAMNKEAE
jgi:hypothetical protein